MLPYYDEFLNSLEDNDNKKMYISRIKPFHEKSEINILIMNNEDLLKFFNKSYTANCNIKSALMVYLNWLNKNTDEDISHIKYVLSRFTADENNLKDRLFMSLDDLLNELDTVENEITMELEAVYADSKKSDQVLETSNYNFIKLKAYYVLMWYGVKRKDMLSINIYDVTDESVYIPSIDRKIEFYSNANGEKSPPQLANIFQELKHIDENGKRKLNGTNLFRTSSEKSLQDLSFKTMGKVDDMRFYEPNVRRAATYYEMYKWEQDHREITSQDTNIIMELCHHQYQENQVNIIVTEYRKYAKVK
ncbi:MAG: hypothetical protein NC452_10375 [Eubacterium sp.]|nr:hypothetical protein [Eubacterium sp.]